MVEPLRIETWRVIDVHELEKLIKEVYGRKFSVLGHYGASNGSIEYLEVPAEDEWAAEKRPRLEHSGWLVSWKYDEAGSPRFSDIVNDLHDRGLIAAGNYYMHCWW